MARILKKKHPKISKLIAEGKEIDDSIKELSKKRDEIKDAIKAHAAAVNKQEIIGDYGSAVFIDHVESATVDIDELWAILYRKRADFFKCVKVNVGSTRTILGKTKFREIASFKTTKFNKVTFGEVENYGEEKKS